MKTTASFEEILTQKMKAASNGAASVPRSSTSDFRSVPMDQDPAHMAFLMGQMQKTSVRPQAAKVYPQKPKPPRAPHILNEAQRQAYEFLQFQGASLPSGFSAHDLKKAFRSLALKLHPDRGGDAQAFICLKTHVDTLKTVFAKSL